ncbi:18073_t:CDS:1, partial [Gigaspora rosea]
TVDNNNKISGEKMYKELLKWAQHDEFDPSDIPKVSTINNWIAILVVGESKIWKGFL